MTDKEYILVADLMSIRQAKESIDTLEPLQDYISRPELDVVQAILQGWEAKVLDKIKARIEG